MGADQLNNAVDGFASGEPVKILAAVIVVLLAAIPLVFKVMNDQVKQAVARAEKAEERLEKHLAEQREDFRNMGHATKTIEGVAVRMSHMEQAQQDIIRAVMRSQP